MASKADYTPGPWTGNGSHIYAPDGSIIAVVQNPGSTASDYPLEQNRNLMVAAPDLLSALRAFMPELEQRERFISANDAPWSGPEKAMLDRISAARAAVTKAIQPAA